MDPVLNRITGVQFNNTSELDLLRVLDDTPNVADQLRRYVAGFSGDVRDIFEKFDLDAQIARLDASNRVLGGWPYKTTSEVVRQNVSKITQLGEALSLVRRL